ncbi:hypothetical protein SCA6_015218 [Theobroma cacao]
MEFTHMVINEIVRAGNLVPILTRKLPKDVEIKGRLNNETTSLSKEASSYKRSRANPVPVFSNSITLP